MDVDDMLALAGDFGRLQYLMMIMFSIVNIFCAFHYFAQTYISIVPEFWCKGSDHLQCQDNENATTCEAGWDYNLTGGFNTVVSELNWVCGHSWYASWGQSPYFVGSVFGTLILGFVADWKGRIPVLVISYLFAFIGNFVTAFSYHLPEFMLGRALAVMEYMRPDMRTFGLNLCIGVFYCIGCVVSPWLALFSGDWRYFLFGISAPMLLVPALAFLLPESAGWLINKGRIEDAVLRFNRIAKINGKEPLTQSAIDRFRFLISCLYKLSEKRYWNAIPGLIMGSLAIAGAACCLHLPETMDKTLPLTLEDGENFGEGEGMWDFACFKKKSKVLTVE
ncbi:hypothetical protein C0J52_10017 [Blattella germanica]|nr:hypothetical protein C0J52_10017 [Blattella germanica]